MVLPEPVTDLLERLVKADGHEILFERLHQLADRIVALGDGDPGALDEAERLGTDWVQQQLNDPPPPSVTRALQSVGPALADLPVIREGFLLWSEAVSAEAAAAFRAMAAEAKRHQVGIIGALVIPLAGSDHPPCS